MTDPAQPGLHRVGGPHQHGQLVDLEGLLGPGHVDVDHRPEIGVGAGVVHQDVQRAEAVDRLGHAGLGLFGVADVGRLPGHLGRIGAPGDQAGRGLGQVVGRAGARA